MGDTLPWTEFEKHYNKHLKNDDVGASNKPGRMRIAAPTCTDAEVRYPTDIDLLEDGSRFVDRIMDKVCGIRGVRKPRTERDRIRQEYLRVIKRKARTGKLLSRRLSRHPLRNALLSRNIQEDAL